VTGSDPSVTDYVREQPAKYPELPSRHLSKKLDRIRMNVYLKPYCHWCASCSDWVCDCVHCVEPLDGRGSRSRMFRFAAWATTADAAGWRLNSPRQKLFREFLGRPRLHQPASF